MKTTRPSGHWRIIQRTPDGDIIGPWHKNSVQDNLYNLAMALLAGETSYSGFQYVAIGTGDPSWDALPSPPEAPSDAFGMYPYLSVNQQEQISIFGSPTGGTYVLSFSGQNATIGYNATATDIQNALGALSNIGVGNVVVTAPDDSSYVVEFVGLLGGVPQPLITVPSSALTGDPTASVTVANVAGTGIANEIPQQETVSITGSPTGGTFTLTFKEVTTAPIAYNATASDVQTALGNLTTIGGGNVRVVSPSAGTYIITFLNNLGIGPQNLITSDGSLLTGGTPLITVGMVSGTGLGEFARFAINSHLFLDEFGNVSETVSRYCRFSVTIPAGALAPQFANDTMHVPPIIYPPTIYRELAIVGGTATAQIGTGMYLFIVRLPIKEIRYYGDAAIILEIDTTI